MVRIAPAFVYGNQHLEIVREYTYLGVVFCCNGKFESAMSNRIEQATLALNALKWRARKLRLPLDITLELFDRCVKPVLLYGCEVWGWDNLEPIEIFHRSFLKECLGLKSSCSNNMIYAETGRMPLVYEVRIRMASYWLRVRSGTQTKIAYKLLTLCERLHHDPSSNYYFQWTDCVTKTLLDAGIDAANITESGLDSDCMRKRLWITAEEGFRIKWLAEVSVSRTCEMFKTFMPDWRPEIAPYLVKLNFFQRRAMARFRCRSNFLPMSSFNAHQYVNYQYLCPLCNADSADEDHYLLSCSYFDTERRKLRDSTEILSARELLTCDNFTVLSKIARYVENILNAFKDLHLLG